MKAKTLTERGTRPPRAKCAGGLGQARREALALADELETAAHLKNIGVALHKRIGNILSVHRIREEMKEAADSPRNKGT